MRVHADLSERVVLDTRAIDWSATPTEGIERRMLERRDEGTGNATYLVRYGPGARYPHHEHPGVEELLVLEGTLSDEHGSYGPGTFVLNPPGSPHAPFSETGCVLLVRQRTADESDAERLVLATEQGEWKGPADGVQRQSLLDSASSGLSLYVSRFAPGAKVPHHEHAGGEELFILDGEVRDEDGRYPAGTWVRQPHGSAHAPFSEGGARVLVRRGHLST